MKRSTFIGGFLLIISLFIYWKYNIGPVSGNTDCQIEKKFKSYEFMAEVVNKYEGGDSKALTLVTFEKKPATIDLTLEMNGLYDKLVIGDTLKKEFGTLIIQINNFEKKEAFEMAFDCK